MSETDAASTGFASASLARVAEAPVPQADVLISRFPLTANPSPLAEDEQATVLRSLHFGNTFTNYTAYARQEQGERRDGYDATPYDSPNLLPAAAVLHYGQKVFESIKAYWYEGGSVWTFRSRYSAARLNASTRRMVLPELAEEDFVASLVDLVRIDVVWASSGEGGSPYLRPFAFVSEALLGVRPTAVVDYHVITSPADSYSPHDLKPVSIWMTTKYYRAGRRGTGAARIGGNYTSSPLPQQEAYTQDCDQARFLDDVSRKDIEGPDGMNLMIVNADGTVRTPYLAGTILESCTRSAIIRLLRDSGWSVVEEATSFQGLPADVESSRVNEVFACGTTAVVVSLGRLKDKDFDACIEGSRITRQIHDQLTAIQTGRAEDLYGWMYQPVPPHS